MAFVKPILGRLFLTLTILFSGLFTLSLHAQVEAIATCPSSVVDSMYRVKISNFLPVIPYTIIVNGVPEVINTPQIGDYFSSNIQYIDGVDSVLVEVIEDPLGAALVTSYIVHELFCIDIDGDNTYDFSKAACDYVTPSIDPRGTIISMAAPYLGENVYQYVLTDTAGIAIETNSSGYFTGLVDSMYNVFAYTFLTEADAAQMVDSITFGTTDMDVLSLSAPVCFGFCGDVKSKTGNYYEIDCELSIEADPVLDLAICNEGDVDFYVETTITGTQPPLTTVAYEWLVDSTGTGFVTTMDGTADSILMLTSMDTSENGNLYKAIAILLVDGVEIDRDTSGSGTLTIYDDATLAASMDTTVYTGDDIGVVFTDGSSNADSFVITAINVPGTAGFTADGGNVSTGNTTNASYIAGDSYVNQSGGPVTVTYVVTPYTSNDCDGDAVTISVVINPCPEVDPITTTVCSDELIAVLLPDDDKNGADIDSFVITANSAGATTGTVTSLSAISSDAYNNTTSSDSVVIYTITPYGYGCEGAPFTVTVTIEPEPAIDDQIVSVCSEVTIGVDLVDLGGYSGPAVDSFLVTADVNGLVGSVTEGTLTSNDAIAQDTFVNLSGTLDSVVYTVIPYAGSCAGESYTITVRIVSQPVGSDPALVVCSDDAFSITLQDLITNGLTGVTFSWTAAPNADVTGVPSGTSTNSTIGGPLTNTSGSSQDVVYTVTPTAASGDGSCVGDPFTVTVTVNPEPVFTDVAETVCSDESIDIDLGDSQTDTAPILGYTYTVNAPGVARTDTTSANITTSFNNITNSDLTITYVVTPITTDSCAGDPFNVVITIQPKPIMAPELDATVCSSAETGVILGTTGTSAAADSFNIISISSGGLTNNAGLPASTGLTDDVNEIKGDSWMNTTTSNVDVTYDVAPVSANGCIGDTITITVTVIPEAIVDAGTLGGPLCSNYDLTLGDLGASVSGGATDGTWTSSGTGTFVDGSDASDGSFSGGVTYKPSLADKQAGGVTLTLTSDAVGSCPTNSDSVTITINNVECSEFPWDGN